MKGLQEEGANSKPPLLSTSISVCPSWACCLVGGQKENRLQSETWGGESGCGVQEVPSKLRAEELGVGHLKGVCVWCKG